MFHGRRSGGSAPCFTIMFDDAEGLLEGSDVILQSSASYRSILKGPMDSRTRHTALELILDPSVHPFNETCARLFIVCKSAFEIAPVQCLEFLPNSVLFLLFGV